MRSGDGAYLAYQVLGEGSTVLFWQEDSFAMVDELWIRRRSSRGTRGWRRSRA